MRIISPSIRFGTIRKEDVRQGNSLYDPYTKNTFTPYENLTHDHFDHSVWSMEVYIVPGELQDEEGNVTDDNCQFRFNFWDGVTEKLDSLGYRKRGKQKDIAQAFRDMLGKLTHVGKE